MNKFRNRRVRYDGILFDSKLERDRYIELKALEKAGEIFALECQRNFPLYAICLKPPRRADPYDNLEKVGDYRADFAYEDKSGFRTVEDAKGMITDLFSWKKRHFEIQYGVEIKLIRKEQVHGSHRKGPRAPRYSVADARSLASRRRNKGRSAPGK